MHLSKIKSLDPSESYVSSLKGGDFAGLANNGSLEAGCSAH